MILGSLLNQLQLKIQSVVADIANSSNHIRSISPLDGELDDL
jgi:hypothetical protein